MNENTLSNLVPIFNFSIFGTNNFAATGFSVEGKK